MGIITIRDVSDNMKLALKQRAQQNQRSMEKEALSMLSEMLDVPTPEMLEKDQKQQAAIQKIKSIQNQLALADSQPANWRFNRDELYDQDLQERGLL